MQPRSIWREMFGVIFRAIVVIFTVVFIFGVIDAWFESELGVVSDGTCNIAVLPVDGVIIPFHGFEEFPLAITPYEVESFFDAVEEEPNIQGVLLEINSPGGTPVASERIAERIRHSELPTIAQIGDMGASGAYLVASAADTLYASPMSDVGGIGVTMSYLEESKKNEEEGITFVELSSGEFKDAGNPNKPLTEEERELFERDLELIHQEFINKVAEYRNTSIENIESLADGATTPGVRAVELGLVDKLGGREEIRQEFANKLSISVDEVEYCEYQGNFLPF